MGGPLCSACGFPVPGPFAPSPRVPPLPSPGLPCGLSGPLWSSWPHWSESTAKEGRGGRRTQILRADLLPELGLPEPSWPLGLLPARSSLSWTLSPLNSSVHFSRRERGPPVLSQILVRHPMGRVRDSIVFTKEETERAALQHLLGLLACA